MRHGFETTRHCVWTTKIVRNMGLSLKQVAWKSKLDELGEMIAAFPWWLKTITVTQQTLVQVLQACRTARIWRYLVYSGLICRFPESWVSGWCFGTCLVFRFYHSLGTQVTNLWGSRTPPEPEELRRQNEKRNETIRKTKHERQMIFDTIPQFHNVTWYMILENTADTKLTCRCFSSPWFPAGLVEVLPHFPRLWTGGFVWLGDPARSVSQLLFLGTMCDMCAPPVILFGLLNLSNYTYKCHKS